MKVQTFLVVLGFVASLPVSAAQTSNDELMKSCEKKKHRGRTPATH